MKIGLYSITYRGVWYRGNAVGLFDLVRLAKQQGWEGLELDAERPHAAPMDWSADDRKRLRDQELAHLKQIQEQMAEISLQRRRADDLLQVILPVAAVAELKATDRVVPRRYDSVTVLFADIVNFTSYCDGHEPEDVVSNLQLLVQACEEVAAAEGLEKIKTIGDAFMATAGLLSPHHDPVLAGVRGAFAMVEAARQVPAGWRLRVGIHVGPVVAGVVGRSKFSYDLWGDTVNVAARLSQFGSDAAVLLSGEAWACVKDRCICRPLGLVSLKGKGAIEVVECLQLPG